VFDKRNAIELVLEQSLIASVGAEADFCIWKIQRTLKKTGIQENFAESWRPDAGMILNDN
jgi:hypothetical protein